MTRPLRRLRPSSVLLLSGLLCLAGCGGLELHQTDFDEWTVTAGGDGGSYGDFESAALQACPQGFIRLSATPSPSGESRYASWHVRCRTMIIHNAE